MVRLAIADNPHFELSLIETHDQGYTYTKETLLRLTKENPDTDTTLLWARFPVFL